MSPGSEALAGVWLATLQRLADRTAHDVRNALNGVAVNLEVVRSRARRGGDCSAVEPFAASAAAELERVTASTDALVALARSPGERADVGILLARYGALLGGPAGESRVVVDLPSDSGSAETPAADAARLILGAVLLGAMDREGPISCRLGTDGAPTVYIECEAGGPLSVASDVERVARAAGITLVATRNGMAISFPPASTD